MKSSFSERRIWKLADQQIGETMKPFSLPFFYRELFSYTEYIKLTLPTLTTFSRASIR